MNNINDIKPIMLWIPINIEYSLIFVIFIVILYFVYKYLVNFKPKEVVNKIPDIENLDYMQQYKKDLNNLEKNYLEISKEIFYSKLSKILRWILELKGQKNISKMTLEEIDKLNINNKLKEVIQNIYFKEYAKEIKDSIEIRKNLIQEVKKLIK
jgi:hypothetical protein